MKNTLVFCLLFLSFYAHSEVVLTAPTTDGKKQAQMRAVQRDLLWLEAQIAEKKKELAEMPRSQAREIRDEIAELEARIERERFTFVEILSDVDLPVEEPSAKPKKRDLVQELQQLIEPLFDAIQRASEKPRRIEAYRTRIFTIHQQLESLEKVLTVLNQHTTTNALPEFSKQILQAQASLSQSRDSLQVQLNSLERNLDRDLGDRRTVWQIVSESTQAFFAAKGRNLLFAILVFSFVYWALLYMRKYIFRFVHSNPSLRPIAKPLQLGYGIASGVLSIFAVIVTLHLLHDNFLVTVLILLLLAITWSSKAVISHFIHETKLALNLGPIKQGERVVWQGVPWLVQSLGFRSVLKNEALQGGTVTLPASALTSMLSRAVVVGEPWFPTRVGDYVELDDGNYGYVETQTPESVVLVTYQTRKYYNTNIFLAQNPRNFSRGFEFDFEVYLRHSPGIPTLTSLRPKFLATVKRHLQPRLQAENPVFRDLKLELIAVGPTLTKAWIKTNCAGELAALRTDLQKELQTSAGEAWREVMKTE